MRVEYVAGELRVSGVAFDVPLVLYDSAQAFHWVPRGGGYAAAVGGRAALVKPLESEDGFALTGPRAGDVSFWREYFDLDRDYSALAAACSEYPVAMRALAALPGLRVLRQPPWEALVAFILSVNNNVARIRRLTLALCEALGDRSDDLGVYGFPGPDALANAGEHRLRALGVGYRAPYLIGAARAVADGFPLDSLAAMPYERARERLMTLAGVGPKVADCILLFGCGHAGAFPVDVWVGRLMRGWFGLERAADRELPGIARGMFGENAGLIQQSLFHCARLGLIEL